MEKKTVLLELPCELIEKIDGTNTLDDRSAFVTDLLQKQLQPGANHEISAATELTTRMSEISATMGITGEIDLVTNTGASLGKFNINTLEGFEELAQKIREVSKHPIVQMRAEKWG